MKILFVANGRTAETRMNVRWLERVYGANVILLPAGHRFDPIDWTKEALWEGSFGLAVVFPGQLSCPVEYGETIVELLGEHNIPTIIIATEGIYLGNLDCLPWYEVTGDRRHFQNVAGEYLDGLIDE